MIVFDNQKDKYNLIRMKSMMKVANKSQIIIFEINEDFLDV